MRRLVIILLLFPLLCPGQIPRPKPDTYINDHTNSLTAGEIYQLNERLYQLEQQTTIQVAVLLINDLPANMVIEDYARTVGNEWKVGNAHNGIVYVAVLHERKQRLEIARNLEGTIPDITAAEIIDHLKPLLRRKDYYNALKLLSTQINDHVGTLDTTGTGNYPSAQEPVITILPSTGEDAEFKKESAKYNRYGKNAAYLLVLGAAGFCVWAWRYNKKYREMYTVNGVYRGIGNIYYQSSDSGDSSGSGSGGSSSGFGGWGGGGGGGGGGFSGGGASGSW